MCTPPRKSYVASLISCISARIVSKDMRPVFAVYSKAMRATRDLIRRRTKLVRTRAEALAHIQNTVSQYNLPPLRPLDKRRPWKG